MDVTTAVAFELLLSVFDSELPSDLEPAAEVDIDDDVDDVDAEDDDDIVDIDGERSVVDNG